MRKYNSLLICFVGILAVYGCKEKKNTGDIITKKPVTIVQRKIQQTGNYVQSRKIKWLGGVYTVETKRVADTSLPLIEDGNTKYYFKDYIDGTYSDGALVGIVLDRAEGDNLLFAASVGSPDKMSDEYIPLLLKVSRQGKVSISKDTQLDTGSSEASEQDLSEEEGM